VVLSGTATGKYSLFRVLAPVGPSSGRESMNFSMPPVMDAMLPSALYVTVGRVLVA